MATAYQNCGKHKVGFNKTASNVSTSGTPAGGDSGSPIPPGLTGDELNNRINDINATCDNGTKETKTFNFLFPKPTETCKWGVNGNLMPRDRFFQARIEEKQNFDLPAGSTLCDVSFNFVQQPMHYDDHMLLTMNDIVLASTIDFSKDFQQISGMQGYTWNAIAGIPWNSQDEGVYCLGMGDGLANCQIIRRITALNPKRTSNFFNMISLGDNDDFDCEHSDVSFSITATFVR